MGTPNYPKDLASEFNRMRSDIKNIFTSGNTRAGMAKIGARVIEITGELVMNAGASLKAKYSNNVDAFFVGRFNVAGSDVDGMIMRRPNGKIVFWNFGNPSQDGFWAFYDNTNNIIIGDDIASGTGLARPWLPYTWVRTSTLTSPVDLSTSTTFAPHHTVGGVMQHPKFEMEAWVACFGSDVAQVRIVNPGTGTVLASSSNIGSSWLTLTGSHENFNFGDTFRYDIEVRRVSGTSTGVGCTPFRITGRQS